MSTDPFPADPQSRQPRGQTRRENEASAGFAVVAAICGLLLCGMLFGASLWILAGVAAGAVLMSNRFIARHWSEATIATRNTIDSEVKIGTTIPVRVEITNSSPLPVFWVLVDDLLPKWTLIHQPPTLGIDGDRTTIMMLWPKQTREIKYTIKCNRRGYFQIGPTVLETGDLMGFYRRYRVGTDPQYVTVLPEIKQLSTYEIGSRRPIGEIRMRASVMDDPTRLRGIRRWQPGDPMRSVHWSATARTGVLHSKIYEPSSIAGATLVLDLHESTNSSTHEPVRSDMAITAAASIAAWLHESGEPFALATNGRDAADRIRSEGWVGDHRVRGEAAAAAEMLSESDRRRPVVMPVGRGPAHLQNMLRTLARLERTDALTLSELLIESESRISAETTVMVILQQATPESIAAIIGLSRRGRAVAVIVNTHDVNDYSSLAGPFIASNIPTLHLSTRESITEICRQAVLR